MNKIIAAIAVVVLVAGAGGIFLYFSNKGSTGAQVQTARIGGARYQEIVKPAGFVNTDKIALGDLVGKKVILVDFMTYSCINCIRTFPYLNAWYEKYKDAGLEIVGIHTPEFAFEKKYENVAQAMKKYGITYPVVLDNEYGTWHAYGNYYWPRKYLIDIHGNIVYDHKGEGAYEETEKKIQELLKERMEVLGEQVALEEDMARPTRVETVEFGAVRSPEIYFGAARNERLGNGSPGMLGMYQLDAPTAVQPNALYLIGAWNFTNEYAENISAGAETKIIFKYYADKVFFVARSDAPVSMQVVQDGKPVEAADSGEDVAGGMVAVQEDRLYRIIDNETGAGEHTLELIITQPGAQLFTFTFG